jgi:hypothetical protein
MSNLLLIIQYISIRGTNELNKNFKSYGFQFPKTFGQKGKWCTKKVKQNLNIMNELICLEVHNKKDVNFLYKLGSKT